MLMIMTNNKDRKVGAVSIFVLILKTFKLFAVLFDIRFLYSLNFEIYKLN